VKILKNCYSTLPNDGKVIVMAQVLPLFPEITTNAKVKSLLDMLMMTQKPGGRERMQHVPLADAAGFESVSLTCHVYDTWIMEFNKKDLTSGSFCESLHSSSFFA
jgi:caffeic acid 3-O-methyltransferase